VACFQAFEEFDLFQPALNIQLRNGKPPAVNPDWEPTLVDGPKQSHAHAVKDHGALIRHCSPDLIIALGERICAIRVLYGLPCGTTDGTTAAKLRGFAAIQGKFVYFALCHHLSEGRCLRLKKRCLGRDLDRLAHIAHLENAVDLQRLIGLPLRSVPG
jgi:hypothetical protein